MTEVSMEVDKRSKKNFTSILQALASVGQASAARALGVSESTVSRMKESELERFALLLAVLGLKAVSGDARCYEPQVIQAIFTLAKRSLDGMENAHEALSWGDE